MTISFLKSAALTLVLFFATASVHAEAADAATVATAKEFVEITQSATLLDKMAPMVRKNFTTLLLRDNPQKAELINQLVNDALASTFAAHNDEFKMKLAEAYADNLTQDQLTQLITFYKGPAGQAYLKAMPAVMTATMTDAKVLMGKNVHEAIQKLIVELKKNDLQVPKEMLGKKEADGK